MLTPNTIPNEEPLLNVGIVLPEDIVDLIELELPAVLDYRVFSDKQAGVFIQSNNYQFIHANEEIVLNKENKSACWIIEPANQYKMDSKVGVKVKNVIAGRGFHWQKLIDVYLPGSIEIRIYDNSLILINKLPLEEYLMCVATSEMGAACPSSLIESQTIAARSWMLANIEQKHVHMGMDVCNDDCCQRYQGSGNLTSQSIKGVENTFGQVLLHNNKICDARYSKSCGGMMETFTTIWPGTDPDYLKSITDAPREYSHTALPLVSEEHVKHWIDSIPETYCSSTTVNEASLKKYLGSVDEAGKYFRWELNYTQGELCNLLNEKLNLAANEIIGFKPIHRGGSGRLAKIEILYRDRMWKKQRYLIDSEYKIRQSFHKGFLYSSCFYIQSEYIKKDVPQNFKLKGAGWGHGVGYCQIGALGMALKGHSTEEIVAHYYPGSKLSKIY